MAAAELRHVRRLGIELLRVQLSMRHILILVTNLQAAVLAQGLSDGKLRKSELDELMAEIDKTLQFVEETMEKSAANVAALMESIEERPKT